MQALTTEVMDDDENIQTGERMPGCSMPGNGGHPGDCDYGYPRREVGGNFLLGRSACQ